MIGRAFNIAPETDFRQLLQTAAPSRNMPLPYVAEFEAHGYLTDCADGRFRPTDAITRAEIVNILGNMIHTLVKAEHHPGPRMFRARCSSAPQKGAALKGMHISGDLILAPGVKGNVTLTDTSVSGSIRNYGTGQVVFAGPSKPEPEEPAKPGIQPSEVYTPGATLDRTFTYSGKEIPIYRDRPLNIFADSDFIWSEEHPDRLEYLGDEFRTRYGIDVSSYQGDD